MSSALSGNHHIAFERSGNGPPLLLLLPQSSGPNARQELVQRLGAEREVVTYRREAQRASSDHPPDVSMAGLAADPLAVMDSLRLPAVDLLCHSTGCGVGIHLATSYHERVSALVLTTPWTHADAHLSTMQELRKTAARVLDPHDYARFNAALLFPPEYRRANEQGFARMAAEAAVRAQDADDIARRLDAILAFDARPLLAAVRCPTLVISARDDQLMPPWFASEMAAEIRGARLIELDGGGHMITETRGDELAAIVLEFLDAIESNDAGGS